MRGKTKEESTDLFKKPWTIYPHLFAKRASRGKWQPYRHLRYLSALLGPALLTGGGRFIVTAPPRHGKSEFISNWIPTWFLYNCPDQRVILGSYALEFASKWGAKVKENLTENPLILTALSQNTKAKRKFATLEGGQMICAGVGGPITGEGADLFVIDDPIKNYQDAMSDLKRETQKDWYRSVVRTRLEPGASVVVLQTRWHEDDLAGWLMSSEDREDDPNRKQWTVINLPAYAEENDVLGRSIGEALCPERYTVKDLQEIEADLEELIWSAMYQQRPTALKGNIILKEWLRFYDQLPAEFDEEIITADLTFKEGTTTDFTVVQKWSRKGANMYLIDQMRARMGFPEQITAIRTMSQRHPNAYLKIIEEAANGAAVISYLKHEIMGLVPVKPQTSKQARLAAVSPMFQSGNVYFPNPMFHNWVDNLIAEVLTFPNAKNDDQVDALCYAVSHMSKASSSTQRLAALGRW